MEIDHDVIYGSAARALWANISIDGASPTLAVVLRRGLHTAPPGTEPVHIHLHDRLPEDVHAAAEGAGRDEGFIITVGERIDLFADSERGQYYAVQSLLRRARNGLLPAQRIAAFPVCPVRGVKLLLPSAATLDDFKRFIDFLAARGYNTIMLEVGGAMAYHRHPEINEGWLAYCAEMRAYPGKSTEIQCAYTWHKNSIHADNGGGGVLSQDTVRELVQYCRERYLDVIPEVPLLSHCDYLLTRHPELAERREDPYPDTYCPSNPATYALVYDVLEEILEVFQPGAVNIGHDEYYSIGLCERCAGRPAPALYAEDIRRLCDFLTEYGVRTQIWGEKLLDAHFSNGAPIGGAAQAGVPATYPAIDLIPREVEILHWYWCIDRDYEQEYLRRGLAMVYGNFEASGFSAWSARIRQPGVRGILISNWGATDAVTLQRNGILFETALAAHLCWNRQFDDADFNHLRQAVFHELYEGGYAEVAGTAATPSLEILHATDHSRPYTACVDGRYYRPEDFLLGEYLLRYADRRESRVPVIDGTNIGFVGASWARKEYDCADDAPVVDRRLHEAAGITLPMRVGNSTWYATRLPIAYPDSPLLSITFLPQPGCDAHVRIRQCRQYGR